MFKQLTAFIFLLVFGFQTFSKAFIVVDYLTNTSSYAKNCENKARPKMHCNGKCQMMKKLQQQEKKDQQNAERRGEKKDQSPLSSESFTASIPFPGTETAKIFYTTLNGVKLLKIPRSLFRPPTA